jgi:glycosyltransferase involved in cell wall biosynthesis
MNSKIEVLYFSMTCNELTWNSIQQNSKNKGSVAPLVFDRLLLKGLRQQDKHDLKIYSFPSVPAIPSSRILGWGFKKEEVTEGVNTKWLPALNVHGLKQLFFFISAFSVGFRWAIKGKSSNKQMVIYSQFLPVASAVILISKIFNIKCTTIIADIPEYLFITEKKNKALRILTKPYIKLTSFIQRKFDKYVFLTEEMNKLINVHGKPYVIIEGICDPELFDGIQPAKVSEKKSIMYAGGLSRKYGLGLLLDAFKDIQDDIELWIFGSGDMHEELEAMSMTDPRIKYFGMVEREKVLKYELSATMMVNLRNPEEELTKFSFPSKTMEYMSSGTPFLTTRLKGIPEEYFFSCYTIDNYSAVALKHKVITILSMTEDIRLQKGREAKNFVSTKKNLTSQSRKLSDLLLV